MTSYRQGLKLRRFHNLTPFTIREVLLVASPYDAFILEEDALLTEQVFHEYRDLFLPASPRITTVSTGIEAIRKLKERRFDLVLTVTRLSDMGINAFGRKVKRLRHGRPVVLLALDPHEIHREGFKIDRHVIDAVFVWNGDAQILLAIIKYIEDRLNIDHDIETGNVRAIVVIEDSPRYYSSFLAMLYSELMKHARSLYKEGVNELHRRMYMNSRPKILHATTYEEGRRLIEKYRHNLMAVISDADILRAGRPDEDAGVSLVELARRADPELPVLLQSSLPEVAKKAKAIGAAFVHKGSPHLLETIRTFLSLNLGFGDFVFRNAQGQEVDRAHDFLELEQKLRRVPEKSLIYHASHNHFSVWLLARSEFEVAEELRPKRLTDFANVEELRTFLIEVVHDIQKSALIGAVPDFSREHFGYDLMIRLGDGALGGKARGLAFFYRRLASVDEKKFSKLPVKFPKSIFITTEFFDAFLEKNHLRSFAVTSEDDRELDQRFLLGRLPRKLERELEFLVEIFDGPMAVRSSSMLEDSIHQPFAGIYRTLMIPNQDEDPKKRHEELSAAVKLVYASTFHQNAKSYLQSTGKLIEEEKMGIILQKLVGEKHEGRFYPTFSGVAESYNFYPVGSQKPDEGIVHLALGLGRFVVDGGQALRFNPYRPGIQTPHKSVRSFLDNTQREFYALDLGSPCCPARAELLSTVRTYDLKAAEDDGTLTPVGSVYSPDDQRVRDDLRFKGPRIVTFNNILRHKAIPLADTLAELLDLGQTGWGGPVEIEFACDMGDWGRPVRRRKKRREPSFYVLQVRPFAAFTKTSDTPVRQIARNDCLCVSHRSLGHGVDRSLRDVVYVRRDRWAPSRHQEIADEIAGLNDQLGKENRSYMLIGPGRWGSADEWLGIPVEWAQISNVRLIVEASPADFDVEPSQGTHFFQNITSLRIGYLNVPPGAEKGDPEQESFLDWAWLDSRPAYQETRHLRHVRLAEPLSVFLDGRRGLAQVAFPGTQPEDQPAHELEMTESGELRLEGSGTS